MASPGACSSNDASSSIKLPTVSNAPHSLPSPDVEYAIVVPTFGRWRAACQVNPHERQLKYVHTPFILEKTLSFLHRHNIAKHRVHLFVADVEEEQRYREALKGTSWQSTRIVIGVRGILAQRNFIVRHFPEGTYIVSIDDDVTDLLWKHRPGQQGQHCLRSLPTGCFHSLILDAHKRMQTHKAYICGLNSTVSKNCFSMHVDGISTRNGEINGFLYFFINRHDEDLLPVVADATEDAERSLRYFQKDRCVLRYRMYCGETRCFENGGGLQSLYAECSEGALEALEDEDVPQKMYKRLRRASPAVTDVNARRKEAENVAATRLHEMFPSLTGMPKEKQEMKTLQIHFLHKGGAPIPSTTRREFQENQRWEIQAAGLSHSSCGENASSEKQVHCKKARARFGGALDELSQQFTSEPVVQWDALLWPFQKNCLDAIEAARDSRSNLVVMSCGTGKTLVELATICRAPEALHVFVAPTLELLWQVIESNFLREEPYGPESRSFAQLAAHFTLFAFCSYKSSEEQAREHHSALARRITIGTCVEELRDFIKFEGRRKLLLVTYCSFDVVKKTLTQMSANVGEMVFDEGHRAGGKLKRCTILNDWPEGTPRRRLFFTATPVRSGFGDSRFNMFRDCGECLFSYSYAQALRDRICRPVNVRLFPTTEDHVPGHHGRRRWIYENIARICLMEHQCKTWNILTYHRYSVSGNEEDGTAESFADEALFKEVFGNIQRSEFPAKAGCFRDSQGSLDIQVFALTMLTENASSVLSKFADPECANGRIRLIASCGMLNEGINTKCANMLVPISASASWVKNIQRFGRIQRNVWGQAAEPALLVLPIPSQRPPSGDQGNDIWNQSLALEKALCKAVGMCTVRGVLALQYQMLCAGHGRELPKELERALHDVEDEMDKIDSNSGGPKRPKGEKAVEGGGGGGVGATAASTQHTGQVLLCPGLTNLFQLSQDGSSSLGINFLEFEEVVGHLEQSASTTAPAWFSEEFVSRWLELQRKHFHKLSPSRQAHLETIPQWVDLCKSPGQLPSRQRLAPEILLAQLKAYADEQGGLEKLYEPSTHPGGERERLLRSWCRHIRLEYNALQAARVDQEEEQSRRRLTREFILELEAIPGWLWHLRKPRGSYQKTVAAKSSAKSRASAKLAPNTRMPAREHFQTLGLPPDAKGATVRRTYKALALKHHPDKNPDCKSSAIKFEQIVTAYNALRQAHLA